MNDRELSSRLGAAKENYAKAYHIVFAAVDNVHEIESPASAERIGPTARKELREKELAGARKALEAPLAALAEIRSFIDGNAHLFDPKAAVIKAAEAPLASWKRLPEEGLTLLSSEKASNVTNNMLGQLLAENLDIAKRTREEESLRRMSMKKLIDELDAAVGANDLRRCGAICAEASNRELSAGDTAAVENIVNRLGDTPVLRTANEIREEMERFLNEGILVSDQLNTCKHHGLRQRMFDHLISGEKKE